MRWQNQSGSDNVEDRRGRPSGGGLPLRGASGLVIVAVVMVAGFYGVDLTPLLGEGGLSPSVAESGYESSAEEEEMARFTSVALKTTEDSWSRLFGDMGRRYDPPRLVMYTGGTTTGCGYGQSAMGPFYCPEDQTVYVDLSFYRDMKTRMGGGGDFAQGYVIAHEVGHHVQHLLGIDEEMARLKRELPDSDSNRLSVALELQADCFAGVWGRSMQQDGLLEPGDVEEALKTAEAIGDDRLQRQRMGRVVPDSFTHGTSAQRYYWFKRGFDSGNPQVCNTFSELQKGTLDTSYR